MKIEFLGVENVGKIGRSNRSARLAKRLLKIFGGEGVASSYRRDYWSVRGGLLPLLRIPASALIGQGLDICIGRSGIKWGTPGSGVSIILAISLHIGAIFRAPGPEGRGWARRFLRAHWCIDYRTLLFFFICIIWQYYGSSYPRILFRNACH